MLKKRSSWATASVVVLVCGMLAAAQTPLGSGFTYQGQIKLNGSPLNGTADLQFRLWNDASAGNALGSLITVGNVTVVNGLFTVELNTGGEFAANAFNGDARWLQINVRSPAGTGSYMPLNPRQALTATPYSAFSLAPWATSGNNVYYNAGKVGIGTSTPADKLTVSQGDLRVDRGTLTTNQQAILTLNGARTGGTNPFASIEFSNFDSDSSAVDYTGARILSQNADGDADSGDLRFFTKATTDANPVQRMIIGTTGNVGIGTTAPTSPLGFRNADERKITYFDNSGSGYFGVDLSSGQLRQWVGNGGNFQIGNYNSTDGTFVERMRVDGTSAGGSMHMVNAAGAERASVTVNSVDCGDLQLKGPNGNVNVWMTNVAGSNDNGWIGVYDSTGTAKAGLYVDSAGSGMMFTGIIQISGGSDIAEPFDVSAAQEIRPGMVVAIDPERTGELRLSTTPYDRTVAGVISGAGGVKPGMTLRQTGSAADGKHPVALTGRVYCYVDADAGGPVRPGDLLTTSGTPGHAMRVNDHARAAGAILGKAMSSLEKGRGLVLVLVSLQ